MRLLGRLFGGGDGAAPADAYRDAQNRLNEILRDTPNDLYAVVSAMAEMDGGCIHQYTLPGLAISAGETTRPMLDTVLNEQDTNKVLYLLSDETTPEKLKESPELLKNVAEFLEILRPDIIGETLGARLEAHLRSQPEGSLAIDPDAFRDQVIAKLSEYASITSS